MAAEESIPLPPAAGRVTFARDFAPAEGWVKPVEQPWRQDICLNGRWQFQPAPVPREWKRNEGIAPELPPPVSGKWDAIPIKIPSPWNVNTWGAGRNVGAGTDRPYWPSSVYYPSYAQQWDNVEMGWIRRTFRVPDSWADRRVILHFEAVGGEARVLINGQTAGMHFDRFLPFELDITALVRRGQDNELLVGVRSMRLFDQKSPTYKHMRVPYPPGSYTDNLCGIWQDVFLLGLPAVRVADVFVKPLVVRDTLETEVTLRNDSTRRVTLELGANIRPWVNLAGPDVLDAPEPKWRLDPAVMNLAPRPVTLGPGETKTVTLSEKVSDRLKLWSPDTPNLYGLVFSLSSEGKTLDRSYTRFGWRECRIAGRDFLLNDKKIQMYGDFLHPFGPFVNSRRYVWAWYRMIKDMNGNAVRPHAQPHPRHYLDLADEMGLLVLDETGMFGSSLQLNFEAPAAWDRYAKHYDDLIRRDRNHPSVFGWSWGNELFAIFIYDKAITKEQADAWYRKLAKLGSRSPYLDPTRNWYSCDGDEDLRNAMPVWNKHFGHGLPRTEWMPKEPNKPMMIGESGGTYYARPGQLAVFNGGRAYESYSGRNEALAIDVYDTVVHLARPRLAFYSPAETAWFGIEHLNLGYHDFARLPDANNGVWFKPFEEGKPGVQMERIPPYVCTLNPGWDPALPLYKPLPMFEAQKAAQATGAPLPCPWDHKPDIVKPASATAAATVIEQVAFAGARDGELFKRLTALGVPLADAGAKSPGLLIVDAQSLTAPLLSDAQQTAASVLAGKGIVLVMFRKADEVSAAVKQFLPVGMTLTARRATSLTPSQSHPWTAGMGLADLYFAEDPKGMQILQCGLDGELAKQGRVLLEASNTDWSLFNDVPENAKCAAVVLYEHLTKPAGSALVAMPHCGGTLAVSAMDCEPTSPAQAKFWRTLLGNMGVHLGPIRATAASPDKKTHDLLLNGPPENK